MDTKITFADDPGRLTEERFWSGGTTSETFQDYFNRFVPEQRIDTLEKLAHSFGSFGSAALSPVEKVILTAANPPSTFDERTEISSARRTENVSASDFLKVFMTPEPGSSSSLNKSANHHGDGVRVERDQLDDGSYSVTEYDAHSGALLRFWIDDGSGKPAVMSKTIIPGGNNDPAKEHVLLPSIFERRAITS